LVIGGFAILLAIGHFIRGALYSEASA